MRGLTECIAAAALVIHYTHNVLSHRDRPPAAPRRHLTRCTPAGSVGVSRPGHHGNGEPETTVINALLRRSFISRTQTRQARVLTPCSHAIPHNHKFRTYNLLMLYVAIIMLEITISSRTHPHSPPTFADLLYLWNNTLRTIDSTPYGSSFLCLSVRRILS